MSRELLEGFGPDGRLRAIREAREEACRTNSELAQPPSPCDGRVRLREVLDWHEVAEGDLPDADLTVIVRITDADEPVWLGAWDGERWRDAQGFPVTVIRWADMPEGGAA